MNTRGDTTSSENDTLTVAELIKTLKQYPQDKIITYDYGLPIEIFEVDDDTLTIA